MTALVTAHLGSQLASIAACNMRAVVTILSDVAGDDHRVVWGDPTRRVRGNELTVTGH